MLRYVVFAWGALYCAGLYPAHSEEPRFVTIVIKNETPIFEARPSIEAFGGRLESFSKTSQSAFEYKFKVSDSDWFNPVNIKVLWKDAFEKQDGTRTDLEQRIRLRIRRDFPDTFEFSIYFANNRSDPEMARLEGKKNVNDQWEVFFRASQIASYYREVFGKQNKYSKRAAKLFFGAAVMLADEPNYFVIMSDDADQFVQEAFDGSTSYADRANLARSVYWLDLKLVDKYVDKDCKTAKLLLEVFRKLREDEPAAFNARYEKFPSVLGEKAKLIAAKCGTS
jgi:hypothetical protein